jgi:hypothetical protein
MPTPKSAWLGGKANGLGVALQHGLCDAAGARLPLPMSAVGKRPREWSEPCMGPPNRTTLFGSELTFGMVQGWSGWGWAGRGGTRRPARLSGGEVEVSEALLFEGAADGGAG